MNAKVIKILCKFLTVVHQIKQIAALTIFLFVCQAKGSILEGKSMDEAAKKISPAIFKDQVINESSEISVAGGEPLLL
jgi:hypothetical protein